MTATSLDFRISNSSWTLLSFTTSSTLSLALAKLSRGLGTGLTICRWNSAAITATNSTCANFFPGQLRTPSDHAINDPLAASMISSLASCALKFPAFDGFVELIHRFGSHVRESEPQYLGSVCNACSIGTTRVSGGIDTVSLPTESTCEAAVYFGTPGSGL